MFQSETFPMKRKRYDDEYRASAVLMLEAAGFPNKEGALTYVSTHLGLPHQTLARWARATQNPPPSNMVHKKGLDLISAIQNELSEIFPAMAGRREDANYRELATAAGILIDKLQLLTGRPTWRGEIIDLLQSGAITPDDVIQELGDDLARELFDAGSISAVKSR